MPPQERRHEEVFGLGDSFTRPELGNDIGLMGALLPFVLKVVAGACVGRGSGQPRMPPRERQHEGLGGIGGFFHTLRSGHAAPYHHGSGWHEGVGFCFSLAVAPVSEGDSFTPSGETAPRPAAGQARTNALWEITRALPERSGRANAGG